MAKWARIQNGAVVEVIDFDPVGKFHPDMGFESVPDYVVSGDIIVNGVFKKPTPPAADPVAAARRDLEQTHLYALRFVETGEAMPADVQSKRAAAWATLKAQGVMQ